jgi:transposase-like protein
MGTRRQFSREFKLGAVRLVKELRAVALHTVLFVLVSRQQG